MFIIPNALYNYYGETRSIENLYPTMLRYLDYLKAKEKDGGYLTFGLGDWVYWKSTTNNTYTSTAYYYLDYTLMARFAGLLGKDAAPYRQKADELKALVNRKFFNPETGVYAEGTQTAQAIALYLGIVPEGKEQLVADKLLRGRACQQPFPRFRPARKQVCSGHADPLRLCRGCHEDDYEDGSSLLGLLGGNDGIYDVA